jgi:hypothetical protein
MEAHMGAAGATGVALLFVLAYSLWGLSVLHNERAAHIVASQQQNLAVK